MAGKLTTHVLDTSRGVPARGVGYRLRKAEANTPEGSPPALIGTGVTNEDGRSPVPILEGDLFQVGAYVLEFDIGGYHRDTGQYPAVPFIDLVSISFSISDPASNLHVPLLVSPFGYTTYRGS